MYCRTDLSTIHVLGMRQMRQLIPVHVGTYPGAGSTGNYSRSRLTGIYDSCSEFATTTQLPNFFA